MGERLEPHLDWVLDTKSPYIAARPIEGVLVCVQHAHSSRRRMELGFHPTRAVIKDEVHELIATDEAGAGMKRTVNRIAYVGNFTVSCSGVIIVRDRVEIGGQLVGYVAGFDETHMPNHMNIVIKSVGPMRDGKELGLKVEDPVVFRMGDEPPNLVDVD